MNNIFEEVKQQLNIQQVIEHYGFKVNRARQFVCPFHNDHKPSASIKNDYFNCFVCGAGGDLITFTAKYLGLSNFDATKELIKEFSLNIDVVTEEERIAKSFERRKRHYQRIREEKKEYSSRREAFANTKKYARAKKMKLKSERLETKKENEKEREEYIRHAGFVLADMHRFLWQGIQLYPYEHERHIKGLQELTVCQYFLDCYEENPLEFCIYCKGAIDRYERELNSINKQ